VSNKQDTFRYHFLVISATSEYHKPLDNSTDFCYTRIIEKRLENEMYRVCEVTDDDGFVTYAVVNRFGGGLVEAFWTRADAEDFIIDLGV
jgi:hypothetical protein